jgi:uncharacterized protein (DUF2147 family)
LFYVVVSRKTLCQDVVMRKKYKLFIVMYIVSFLAPVMASENGVLGFWKTIDDKSLKPRSIVEVFETDAKIFGKIVKIYPHEGNKPNCDQCPDQFKGQPILGLQFMWDLKKTSSATKFEGGQILDPESGSVYKSKVELIDGGKKLDVRGYVGISLFGRSQQWIKVDQVD